jgi:hypothetical protein
LRWWDNKKATIARRVGVGLVFDLFWLAALFLFFVATAALGAEVVASFGVRFFLAFQTAHGNASFEMDP